MYTYFALAVALILLACLLGRTDILETLQINWIVWLTVNRGILTVNPFWWRVNDLFPDSSGVELFQQLQLRGPFVRATIFGHSVVIVTDVGAVQEILDHSPDPFGVGRLKHQFFKPFMEFNVGVSSGCPWRRRRALNDYVLHEPLSALTLPHLTHLPTNFDAFSALGRAISTRIVFGEGAPVYPPVFDIFAEANSMWSVLLGGHAVDPQTKRAYTDYVKAYMADPLPGSLVAVAQSLHPDATELLHQIPHWIFPLNGLIAVAAPRLLALLVNNPEWQQRVVRDKAAMRACILELFRLNNPVNSTFRTLSAPYTFTDGATFPSGTQFLVLNNPMNRDPAEFRYPSRFMPQRWTPELEGSYYALMFNQGPQKCPGKEMAIQVLGDFIAQVLACVPAGKTLCTNLVIDPLYVPQMLNPTTITFWVQ